MQRREQHRYALQRSRQYGLIGNRKALLSNNFGSGGAAPVVPALLLENGTAILLEDGTSLLLE